MELVIIDKYLIINSNREVLVFVREGDEISDIFLPREKCLVKEESSFQERMISLLKHRVINEENKAYLYEQRMYENRKGEEDLENHIPMIKRYYTCISKFDEKLVREINELCNEFKILPYLISLQDLKQKAWKSIKVPRSKREIAIDIDLTKAIKILQYKLDYVEY